MAFAKGHAPWNKGLTAKTDVRVAMYSEKRRRPTGRDPWNKGLTKETDKRVAKYAETYRRTHWARGRTKETDPRIARASPKRSISLRKAYKEGRMEGMGGHNWGQCRKCGKHHHHAYKGKPSKRKGKTLEEMYGEVRASEMRKKRARTLDERGWDPHPNGMSQEAKLRISRGVTKSWTNPEVRERQIKAMVKALMVRPSSYEQKIIDLINENELPYRYVGDGQLLIGFRNPDFLNCNGQKVVIEVFSDYFKERDYGSVENYMEVRAAHFAKDGFKTIFLGDKDILRSDWKKHCLEVIQGVRQ